MEKEEFNALLNSLPEEMKTNPKQFFKLVKAVGGISKAGVLVKEVITEDGDAMTTEKGGSQMIRELYCPGKPRLGNPITEEAVSLTKEFQWHISDDEMSDAIDKLSWKKSTGIDDMPDTFFHGILEDDRKDGNYKNTRWLSKKVEGILNSRHWPQYLFSARPILLSKNGESSATKKNVRILSVIPAITKLIERVILSRMEP